MDSVTAKPVSDSVRDYSFDSSIKDKDMDWLTQNRFIDHYELSGKTVTVHATEKLHGDWDNLETSFIIPGFKRIFGSSLKVRQAALTR